MNTYEVIFKISYVVNANNEEEAFFKARNQFDYAIDTDVKTYEEKVSLL